MASTQSSNALESLDKELLALVDTFGLMLRAARIPEKEADQAGLFSVICMPLSLSLCLCLASVLGLSDAQLKLLPVLCSINRRTLCACLCRGGAQKTLNLSLALVIYSR